MQFNHKAPVILAALAVVSNAGLVMSANADVATKSGTTVLAHYSEAVKTETGKEVRNFRVEYNWDEGATYTHSYDKSGNKVNTTVIYSAPTANEKEIAEALAIVQAHPDVVSIKNRQAGIDIAGGFPFEAKQGACARPARCLQVFLFDAENVVRHMMVDMRTSRVVETDYIPPQNKGAFQ